jgi:hypothetical protein
MCPDGGAQFVRQAEVIGAKGKDRGTGFICHNQLFHRLYASFTCCYRSVLLSGRAALGSRSHTRFYLLVAAFKELSTGVTEVIRRILPSSGGGSKKPNDARLLRPAMAGSGMSAA